MKRLSLLLFTAILSFNGNAQCDDYGMRGPVGTPAPGVMDAGYLETHVPTQKVIPYPFVREADVTWSKKIWRVVDLREKFNHNLYYPLDEIDGGIWNKNSSQWSLWTVIRQHVMTGELTMYSPFNPAWEQWTDGDQFKYPVVSNIAGGNFCNDDDLKNRMFIYLGREIEDPFAPAIQSVVNFPDDSVIFDPVTNRWVTQYPPADTVWFTSKDIVQYKIKEQVFFDKERSVMETRIIGIAPVIYARDVNGNITGYRELFWLYYPQCRYVFQNYFAPANHQNSSQRMSFEDLFRKRRFSSYITKESNIYGREIESYKAGVGALLESERIKGELNNFEHDLWSF